MVVFAWISEPSAGSIAMTSTPSCGAVNTVPCGGAVARTAVRLMELTEFGLTSVRTHSTTVRSSLTVEPEAQ